MAVEERVRPLSAMYILGYLSKGVAEFAELAPDTYLEREASYTTPRRAARLPTPKKGASPQDGRRGDEITLPVVSEGVQATSKRRR
jgi:hypothetical protein